MEQTRQPSFLIIGAQKSGTTSLHHYLSHHPQLCASDQKELHFFNHNANYNQGLAFYPPHFSQAQANQLCYESTPDYFHQLLCAKRMAAFNPQLKLIVLLREPIARAYSAWYMLHKPLPSMNEPADQRPFVTAMRAALEGKDIFAYLSIGKYLYHLERLFQYFPHQQVLILDFAQLVRAPEQILQQVYRFLGVQSLHLKIPFGVYNAGQAENIKGLDPAIYADLQKFFQPHNQALKNTYQLNFPWLNDH